MNIIQKIKEKFVKTGRVSEDAFVFKTECVPAHDSDDEDDYEDIVLSEIKNAIFAYFKKTKKDSVDVYITYDSGLVQEEYHDLSRFDFGSVGSDYDFEELYGEIVMILDCFNGRNIKIYDAENDFMICWLIDQGNVIKNSVISSNSKVVVIGNEVIIDGVKMPPCPTKGHNSTIINNKVYLNGYELVNRKWKKTLKALWHKWF